jgi:hypothetical protein
MTGASFVRMRHLAALVYVGALETTGCKPVAAPTPQPGSVAPTPEPPSLVVSIAGTSWSTCSEETIQCVDEVTHRTGPMTHAGHGHWTICDDVGPTPMQVGRSSHEGGGSVHPATQHLPCSVSPGGHVPASVGGLHAGRPPQLQGCTQYWVAEQVLVPQANGPSAGGTPPSTAASGRDPSAAASGRDPEPEDEPQARSSIDATTIRKGTDMAALQGQHTRTRPVRVSADGQ